MSQRFRNLPHRDSGTCRNAAFVLAFCLALSLSAAAQEAAPPPLPAGVHVGVTARPQTATVGDPVTVEIDVSHPKGYKVRMPKPSAQQGDFTVLEFGPAVESTATPVKPAADGVEHDRVRLTVAVYKTGAFSFPRQPLIVVGPDGKEYPASTDPVSITIQTVLTDKDSNLKDLKRQAEIEEPFPWRTWVGVASILALLAALAWWFLRKRRRLDLPAPAAQPELSLLEVAEVELRELNARGLPEKGLMKPFYVSLSEIVRKILEGGFCVTTAEKTTTEIVDAMEQNASPKPEPARLESIESLLSECDLVKFAKYVPPREEAHAALKSAVELLEFCKTLRAATPAPAVEVR
jgi:hypothetical protein